MINHKCFFFKLTAYFCADINDVNITFRTRQPPAEENKYANGIYFMSKSRFFLLKIDLTKSFNTFCRKLVKQFFFRNYKGTTFITSSTTLGQLLLRMRRNGHKTTSGVKFDSIFRTLLLDFLLNETFCKLDHDLMHFSLFSTAHAQNGNKTTSSQIFDPKFETPMGCFLFDYEFWWCLLQDLCVFWAKKRLS